MTRDDRPGGSVFRYETAIATFIGICYFLLAACAGGSVVAPRAEPPPPAAGWSSPAQIIKEAAASTIAAIEPWRKRCAGGEKEACLGLLARLQRASTDAERSTYAAALEAGCGKGVTSACAGAEQARAGGHGLARDPEGAVRTLDELCARTSSSFACSYAYERHAGGAEDPVRLASLEEPVARSCAREPGPSCLNVAQSKQMPLAERMRLIERACDGEDAYACYIVGLGYEEGSEGVSKDAERAQKAHRRACDLLWPESCYNLAWLVRGKAPPNAEYGRLAELACTLEDSKACDDLAKQAAEGGDPNAHERYCRRWGAEACYAVATDLVKQRGETAEDAEELFTLAMLSCGRGFQGGCRIMSHLVKDTRRWCSDSTAGAEHRNSCAFSGLSRLFDQPPDRQEALDELGRSCAAGAAISCHRVEQLRAEDRNGTAR